MAPPHSLKYTDDMPTATTGGYARAWMVRIRPRYRHDQGIHAHEIDGHVKRWWCFAAAGCLALVIVAAAAHALWGITWVYGLVPGAAASYNIYYATRWGRCREEINAYRIQLGFPPATNDPSRSIDEYRWNYAQLIASKYGLTITQNEAYRMLGGC